MAACRRRRGAGRRPGQGRSAAVLLLALPCDGRPQPGQRAAAFGGDGGHGRIPAPSYRAAAQLYRLGGNRGGLGGCTDRGHARVGRPCPTRSQTTAGGVDGLPAGLRGDGRRARRGHGRRGATGRARGDQGPAVPGGRGVAERAGHQTPRGSARCRRTLADGRLDRDHRRAGPGRDRAAVLVGHQGRSPDLGARGLPVALRGRPVGCGRFGCLRRQDRRHHLASPVSLRGRAALRRGEAGHPQRRRAADRTPGSTRGRSGSARRAGAGCPGRRTRRHRRPGDRGGPRSGLPATSRPASGAGVRRRVVRAGDRGPVGDRGAHHADRARAGGVRQPCG